MNKILQIAGGVLAIASSFAWAQAEEPVAPEASALADTSTPDHGEAPTKIQSAISESIAPKYTSSDEETPLVHVYTPDEINQWVERGNHIYVIKTLNQCQFASDIEKRARKGMAAAYEFLYGEMLINGACFTRNIGNGIYYIQQAVDLGYPAAMRRLAFFYETGRYVSQDVVKSESMMHEAAMMGFVPARIDWGGMLARNLGSPRDYEEAYSWLHGVVPASPAQSIRTREYMALLRERMPENVVERALRHRFK